MNPARVMVAMAAITAGAHLPMPERTGRRPSKCRSPGPRGELNLRGLKKRKRKKKR